MVVELLKQSSIRYSGDLLPIYQDVQLTGAAESICFDPRDCSDATDNPDTTLSRRDIVG